MEELPNVKALERQLVAKLVVHPKEYGFVDYLQPKHFLDQQAAKAFERMKEFAAQGATWNCEDDFRDCMWVFTEPFEDLLNPDAAGRRILEAYECRSAYLKAKDIMAAAHKRDIAKVRELTGQQEVSAHPWSASRYTLSDAFEPRPAREYAIAPLIRMPSLSIFYGRPGGFKTLLALSAAAAVASGQKWLTQLPSSDQDIGFETLKAPALYIDFDNGRDEMAEKVEAIARGMNLLADDPFVYYSMPAPRLNCRDASSIALLETVIRNEGARFVVLDNLGLISGGADENSAEMAEVMGNLRWLSEETSAAIFVVHHTRKTTAIKTRAGESIRGHSSIEAAIDLGLMVEREDASDMATLYPAKVRGAPIRPFGALFSYEHKESGNELASCRFWGIPLEDENSDLAIADAIGQVLKEAGELPRTKLVAAVMEELPDARREHIRSVLDRKHAEGAIISKAGKYNAKLYSLPVS